MTWFEALNFYIRLFQDFGRPFQTIPLILAFITILFPDRVRKYKMARFFNIKVWFGFWLLVFCFSFGRMILLYRQIFSSGYAIYSGLMLFCLWFFPKYFDDVKAWGLSFGVVLYAVSFYEGAWQFYSWVVLGQYSGISIYWHFVAVGLLTRVLSRETKMNGWKSNKIFYLLIMGSLIFNIFFERSIVIPVFIDIHGPMAFGMSRISKLLPCLTAVSWCLGFKK